MKHFILIFVLSITLLSCSTRSSLNIKGDNEKNKVSTVEHFKTDTIGYNTYQTFDEFTMKGKGKPVFEPYVFVKRIDDTIIVKSSLKIDSIRVYYKLPCGTWYSYMEFEMWKKNGYTPTKTEWDRFARTYKRYFYNDTILEIRNVYSKASKFPPMAIVKTHDSVFTIDYFNADLHINKLRSDIYSLTKEQHNNAIRIYSFIEKTDTISYVNKNKTYHYKKYAYGMWGIQPGLDETCIYSGQDIRNFNLSHPNGIALEDDTTIYNLVDSMPRYPGGEDEYNRALTLNVCDPLVKKTQHKVIAVQFVVEKDGSFTDIQIRRSSLNEVYDKKAIELVKNLPRFTPAILNGKKVRCMYGLPIFITIKSNSRS